MAKQDVIGIQTECLARLLESGTNQRRIIDRGYVPPLIQHMPVAEPLHQISLDPSNRPRPRPSGHAQLLTGGKQP